MISNRMENMRSTLMSIQKEFADDFQRTAAASREEVMKVLKPGEAAPGGYPGRHDKSPQH